MVFLFVELHSIAKKVKPLKSQLNVFVVEFIADATNTVRIYLILILLSSTEVEFYEIVLDKSIKGYLLEICHMKLS